MNFGIHRFPLKSGFSNEHQATDVTDELRRVADELLCHRLPAGHLPVRLLGMGASGLDDTGLAQGMLFDGEQREKQSRVDTVADEIKERFGTGAIRRGSSLRGESPRTL